MHEVVSQRGNGHFVVCGLCEMSGHAAASVVDRGNELLTCAVHISGERDSLPLYQLFPPSSVIHQLFRGHALASRLSTFYLFAPVITPPHD